MRAKRTRAAAARVLPADDGDEQPSRVSLSELRAQLSATLSRVAAGKEPLVVHRQGKDLVAIVPVEDLELLEKIEDRLLVEEAERRMADPANQDRIPWEQVKRDLGL